MPLPPALTRTTAPLAVLAAAFLFNLGQGVLRPSLPLYLQHAFGASYRMVTVIPTLFGAAKWATRLPGAYLQERWGRARVMAVGLLVIAGSDVGSVLTGHYAIFLAWRALAGVGWALFGTVATTAMVDRPHGRGRAISALLISESLGLLVGSAAGGSLYQRVGPASPFLFEALCMVVAALVVAGWAGAAVARAAPVQGTRDWRTLAGVLRVRAVLLMSVVGATLVAIQTGLLVFLFPLHLAERGGLTAGTVGYLVSLSVAGRLIGLWLGGRRADRADRMAVLARGLLGYGVVLAVVPALAHPGLLAAWSVLLGAGAGFVAGLPTAIVADRVEPSTQAIAIGGLLAAMDAGMLIGPLVMGQLADALDLSAAFLFAGLLLGALAWGCRSLSASGSAARA